MINTKLKKVLKSTVSLMLVLGLMATTAACDKGGKADPNKPSDGGQETGATYTYNDYQSTSPNTWNPHEYKMSDEGNIIARTSMGLYDFVLNEERDKYVVVPEMAAGDPVDVTSEYAGDERFNVPKDATEQYAYKVTLNPDACWENGEKINADTYIYSMQQLLDYKMKNYRASDQYNDKVAIANAEKYCKQQRPIYTDVCIDAGKYRDVEDKDMKFSFKETVKFFDGTATEYYSNEDYKSKFILEDGTDLYEKYSKDSYNDLTEEAKADLLVLTKAFGDNNEEAYKEFCFTYDGVSPAFDWENVGFLKTGEYEITYVVDIPVTPFFFKYSTSSIPLVYEKLYEENKKETGDMIKTTYGTTVDTYMSYGPFKLVEYQNDKIIKYTRNDKWYGYTDGKHEGQYQATDYVTQIVKEQATQLQLFLQGKLDIIGLKATDMDTYRSSDYLVYTPATTTWKLAMNSSKTALKARESEGINKSIMSYVDFRHAVSLSINREEFTTNCTASNVPGFSLYNDQYIYDPATGSNYRNSEAGKKVLTDMYEVNTVEEITGYDKAKAAELFEKAYQEALANGDIKATDKVQLEYAVSNKTESITNMINFFMKSIEEGVKGTSLEGRVEIKIITDEDYYDHIESGLIDMAFTGWTGSSLNPYGLMDCYCNPKKSCEYGFDPDILELTLNIDGKDVTMTYEKWEKELNKGKYSGVSSEVRLQVLAGIEKGILESYVCPPLMYSISSSLHSMKVENGTDSFVPVVGFGGIRYRKFLYNDAEWDKLCKDNNNKLQY